MSSYEGKVGDAIASLIPDWAVDQSDGCDCKNMQQKLNDAGWEWCNENKNDLTKYLARQAQHLKKYFALMPNCAVHAIARIIISEALRISRPN